MRDALKEMRFGDFELTGREERCGGGVGINDSCTEGDSLRDNVC